MQKVIKLDYHRNGVCGQGFYAGIVDDDESGRMVVVRVPKDDDGNEQAGGVLCFALNIDMLKDGNVEFGHNSWRGDHYADVMDKAIKKHEKELDKKLSIKA